jgi:YbgC/YbaW family acyl-CoA thioester hydrolase
VKTVHSTITNRNIPDNNSETLISKITVVSYEMDSFGHVNNAVFLNYLEKARGDFLLAKGLKFKDFSRWNAFPLVVKVNLEYKFPAFADDELLIKGWVIASTATSFTMHYEIFNQNKRLLLTGETFHVFVDKNNRPTRIPKEFKENFLAQ